ncbi:DUF2157 domain-containing protein [Alkalibacillus haloalkaliphilus]|uniref:DUF2157 domain-containing protein n=1 Tax=Alkalibacillus haloalkaliphilus TaxID=94136 RepID=A0A511W4G9_9BACI|nr:DUF2157 domain-containing protein [Alkalibacillus haloalkaliphilus]GEN45681.1 hypothetical protein AHA02nite_14570 [Alkalibacillus haloalkaliphilus]
MKKSWIESESKKWVEEGIIDESQKEAIASRYERQSTPMLFFFLAAVLIGLACLSLIAANWTSIHHLWRVVLIIGAMLLFYFVGARAFMQNRQGIGVFAFVVALSIFGAGIFLLGDMYHFSMNSAFAFLVWGLAVLLIYLSQPQVFIWIFGLVVVFIGQLVSTMQLHDFNWLLMALFVVGYGTVGYFIKQQNLMWLFTSLLAILLFAFSIQELTYYWYTIFALILYLFSYIIKTGVVSKPLQGVSVLSMFIIVVYQALFFNWGWQPVVNDIVYYLFLIPFLSLAVLLAVLNRERFGVIQLVLFLPVFVWPEFSTLLAALVLFAFSIGKMIEGDQFEDSRKEKLGIIAFLISVSIVYVEVAWVVLDRTLFFLIGGIILFIVGLLLNRYQQNQTKGSDDHDAT